MSVPFFIGEERLKTKIGLASIFLLGLAVSHVAANETEAKASLEESSVQVSSSKVEEKKSETTTSQKEEEKKVESSPSQRPEKKEEVKETRASSQKEESKATSTSAHWEGDFYVKADGSKAKSEWIFDTSYKAWFYIKADGRYAQKEWHGNYYLKVGGYMAKNEWIYDNNYKSWFYLKADGSYAEQEWHGNYYLKVGGYMAKSEWFYDNNYKSWFYLKSDGSYANQEWYGKYYLKVGGYMAKSEWFYDTNYKSWFYLKSDGSYANQEWYGKYYLKAGGYMAKSEWFYDNNYKSWFYLKSDGSYANQEWQKVDGKWYYFKKWGYMAKDEWQGNYYLTGSGAMATGELVMDDARYIFSDSGELKEKKDLNVGWVHRNGRRYFFNHREEQVGTDQVKKVIDVSEHNGRISDWKKVIDDNGVDGVIVRLGYSGVEDKELAYNIQEFNRLGIPYGVYLYTYAENETDAENDAKQTIELLKKYKMNLSYPIYYDVENWEYGNKTKRAPSDTGTWVKIINKYMATMKQAGYQNVYVYSYRSLLQTRLKHPDILKHVNWVAAYTNALEWENPHYSGEKGWQYTSSEYLKGIRGRVDVSVWY